MVTLPYIEVLLFMQLLAKSECMISNEKNSSKVSLTNTNSNSKQVFEGQQSMNASKLSTTKGAVASTSSKLSATKGAVASTSVPNLSAVHRQSGSEVKWSTLCSTKHL